MNKIILIAGFCLISLVMQAQELNAKVSVLANRVSNTVPRNTFTTLQSAVANFLNNRKWSNEVYAANEKIDCNFLLNLEQTSEMNVYTVSLTVQAARPAYNSSYLSPIINYKDDNFIMKYQEFQILEFNENRVSGNDALVSNLTAVLAYYAHLILAFDNASFSNHGGDFHFQKAQNIVNNAPDGRGISGWKPFDGIRNRYWLVENMTNSRYNMMHDVYYTYYRNGMDKMYEDENAARTEFIKVLNLLSNFNNDNPNTMINQFFFQGKSSELIKIFSKAKPQEKAQARELLAKLDLTNALSYKEQLK
jgi:hypothetical protein